MFLSCLLRPFVFGSPFSKWTKAEEVGHAPNCIMVYVIIQSGACIFLQVDLEGIEY